MDCVSCKSRSNGGGDAPSKTKKYWAWYRRVLSQAITLLDACRARSQTGQVQVHAACTLLVPLPLCCVMAME